LNREDETEGFEHHHDLPVMGLAPSRPEITDFSKWVEKQAEDFSEQLVKETSDHWKALYCQPVESPDLAASGDRVHQCLRYSLTDPPTFATQWYQRNLGVSVEEAASLLDLTRG